MAFSEFERKRYERAAQIYIDANRPPVHIRNELDLGYRLQEQSVEVFEIRPLWRNPAEKIEQSVAKATYVKKDQTWRVYWQRADLKWHRYDPRAVVSSIEEFFAVVQADEYGCFFG
jgi:hypothetical protein